MKEGENKQSELDNKMPTLEEKAKEAKDLLESMGGTVIVPISYTLPEPHVGEAVVRGEYYILGKPVEVEKHYQLHSMTGNVFILKDFIDDLQKLVRPCRIEQGEPENQWITVTIKPPRKLQYNSVK